MPAGPPAAAPPAGTPASWDDVVRVLAEQEGVPVPLALAVGKKESNLNPDAVGDSGQAIGMFQLHSGAAADTGVDRTDPVSNIRGGLKYLKQLNARYQGDVMKVLQAYNGGMKGVDEGAVSPGAQAYAAEVIANLSQNVRESRTVPPAAAAAPAVTPPAAPAAAAPTGRQPGTYNPYVGPAVSDFLSGAKSQIAKTIYGGGDLVRRGAQAIGLPVERIIDKPDVKAAMTAPDTFAGHAGQFVTEAAEYAIPANQITATVKGLGLVGALTRAGLNANRARLLAAAAEGSLQAANAAGISVLNGDDPKSAALVSAAMPVAAEAVTSMAPAIRRAAVTRLARFMERGAKPGPITPETERHLAQAANDFIDLPLQRTWRQTAKLTLQNRQAVGGDLGAALQGPLGATPVPYTPIVQGLDDLIAEAQHIVPAGGGQFQTVTYKRGIVEAVNDLKTLILEHDPTNAGTITAQQLHNLKSVWQKAVFPIKESAKPVEAFRELLTSAQKEAYVRGYQSIANVLEQNAPRISELDDAVSHAIKLDQFVKRLSGKARTGTLAKPSARYAIGAAGGAAGVAVGSAVGHPIIGAHIGYATSRMLISAIESPRWRLLPIAARRRVADALARGDADRARKLITPLYVSATNGADDIRNQAPEGQFDQSPSSSSASR